MSIPVWRRSSIAACGAIPPSASAQGDELREALEQLRPNQKTDAPPEGNPTAASSPSPSTVACSSVVERSRHHPRTPADRSVCAGRRRLWHWQVVALSRRCIAACQRRCARRWAQLVVRSMVPGKKPLAALCNELAPLLNLSEEALASKLRTDPSELGRMMHKQMAADRGVVLFIDQLEEIVTIGAEEEATVVAAAALGYLCSRIHSVRMLMTVRSDFLAPRRCPAGTRRRAGTWPVPAAAAHARAHQRSHPPVPPRPRASPSRPSSSSMRWPTRRRTRRRPTVCSSR